MSSSSSELFFLLLFLFWITANIAVIRILFAGRLFGLKLILYGTREDPLEYNEYVYTEAKETETVNVPSRVKGQRCERNKENKSKFGLQRTCN